MNAELIMTADGAWSGGHYELLIDLGGGEPAPGQVAAAAAALWAHPVLDGPYPRRDLEPGRQVRTDPASGRGHGVATMADGVLVPCASYSLSSIPGFLPDGEPYPPDVLVFYLPLGSLSRRVWPQINGFPFAPGQDTRPWQEPLEDWFAGIAVHIYARARFKLAVTDFEIDVAYDLWRSWGDGTVPADRRIDLHLGSGAQLERFPRTVWA